MCPCSLSGISIMQKLDFFFQITIVQKSKRFAAVLLTLAFYNYVTKTEGKTTKLKPGTFVFIVPDILALFCTRCIKVFFLYPTIFWYKCVILTHYFSLFLQFYLWYSRSHVEHPNSLFWCQSTVFDIFVSLVNVYMEEIFDVKSWRRSAAGCNGCIWGTDDIIGHGVHNERIHKVKYTFKILF